MIRIALLILLVLTSARPAFADCANPTLPASAIIYNSDFKTMQFCDGTDWWSMKGGGLTNNTVPCDISTEGTIRYESASKTFQGCDGASWSALGGSGGTPSGTIAAFDLASCPSGWTAYAAGVGRVIVGVGTYAANADDDGSNASFNYTLGTTGGRRDHVLSVGEMPAHTHTTSRMSSGSSYGASAGANDDFGGSINTGSTGGGGAHENRPPYVALLYCKKD